jgi:hypothetical protein
VIAVSIPGTRLELVRPKGRGILRRLRSLGGVPNTYHSSGQNATGIDTQCRETPLLKRPVTLPLRVTSEIEGRSVVVSPVPPDNDFRSEAR